MWQPPHIRSAVANVSDPYATLEIPTIITTKRAPRYAVASSVMTARFTQYAMMLGYTLQKHNDFEALDAELILLVRTEGKEAVTPQNITRLERVGWKIMIEKDLEFQGVDKGKIRPYHRYNLNKLYLWSYTNYERIVFIDADTLCKASIAELFDQPGGILHFITFVMQFFLLIFVNI